MKTTTPIGPTCANVMAAGKKASHEAAKNGREFNANLADAGRDIMAIGKKAGQGIAKKGGEATKKTKRFLHKKMSKKGIRR
jgi:F0F1-type ATP synthase membrane subunit b/b'